MEEKGKFRWAIIGGIIPIIGLVLYFKWKKTRPGDAKYALQGAIISFVMNLIFTVILTCVQVFLGYTPFDLVNMVWNWLFGKNLFNF